MTVDTWKLISRAEIAIGVIAIGFALFLYIYFNVLHPRADPHGFIFFGALATLLFGGVTVGAGFLATRGAFGKIAGQLAFVLVAAFLYVEWFTSYSGWYF